MTIHGALLLAWALHGATDTTSRRLPVDRDDMVRVAPAEVLAVQVVGPAPSAGVTPATIVILPGPVGSAWSMRRVTAPLVAQGYRVVVIDALGMGRSARPAHADYSLSAQAHRVAVVLDTLHVDHALVVAQGTSATIALRLAASAPARVSGVLSLAGGPVERQGTAGVRLALTLAPLLDNPLGRALARRRFAAAMRSQSADPTWCTGEVVARYLAPMERDLRATLRTLRDMQDATEPTTIDTELARVRAPVRVLLGDHPTTHAPSADQLQRLRRTVAQLRVDTIARAGTMLHEERADAVVAAVLDMLGAARER